MPYVARKQDDKYVVYKKKQDGSPGERVGATAGTKPALKKYLTALHLNAAKNENVVKENDEIGMQPYEGEMAKSDTYMAMQYALALHKLIKRDIDLPEWIESKITLAKDYLQTCAEYMYTELSNITNESADDEEKKAKDLEIKLLQQKEKATKARAAELKKSAAELKKSM